MLPSDWRKLDRSLLLHHLARGQPKAKVARDLLGKFVAERPDDRFALMFSAPSLYQSCRSRSTMKSFKLG